MEGLLERGTGKAGQSGESLGLIGEVVGPSGSKKPQKLKGARESTVCFQTSVNVVEIASHRSYSDRIRKTIWFLRSEFAESVTRNSLEFLSEGWNPDHVLEEKDFVFPHIEFTRRLSFLSSKKPFTQRRGQTKRDEAEAQRNVHQVIRMQYLATFLSKS